MPTNASSKAEVLSRIRKANDGPSTEVAARAAWDTIPRTYNRTSTLPPQAALELFEDRLRDYDATVTRTSLQDLPAAIAAALTTRGKQAIVIPAGLPSAWLPNHFTFTVDEPLADSLTPTQLDAFDAVLTASSVAIAETGTVVLQSVPGQGRRALSLVPDYHLCIVRAEDVVATVPEAFARLQPTAALATTFISGPSATADIEMTRIKGVHGPRVLDVLLVL
jgi:L-lactate dehydrogenase complex protein LldG